MKNRYPGACSICKSQVPAGRGDLSRDNGKWTVTHTNPCPKAEVTKAHAELLLIRALRILDAETQEASYANGAIRALARLVTTGWLTSQQCRDHILQAKLTQRMDRLDVEEILLGIPDPARKN